MIFVDASEGRDRSNTPLIQDAQYVTGLEAATGADVLISPLSLPYEALAEHLKGGILVQLKIGHDLISSMQDNRLPFCLAKFQTVAANSWQRWLIYTGNFKQSAAGETLLENKPTGLSWASFDGQLAAWGEGGGVYHNVPQVIHLNAFLQRRLTRLIELSSAGPKEVYPILHFPAEQGTGILRQLKPVKDFRVMLTALPGVGVGGAQKLWDFFDKNPVLIITWLTDPNALKLKPKPEGFGPKTMAGIREYFKLNPPDKLGLIRPQVSGPPDGLPF